MELMRRKGLWMWLVLGTSTAAVAAPLTGLDPDFLHDAGYFEAGPIRIYPALSTAVGYDNNIFESSDNTKSSTITRVVPELSAVLSLSNGYLQLGGQADDKRYLDSSDDNFTDRTLYFHGLLEANYRNRFNFDANYLKSHDSRGTGLSEGADPALLSLVLAEPDEYTDQRGSIKYEFGSAGAAGKLRFAGDFLDHSYDNHQERTRFFDRDEYGVGATFLWRVQPRTSVALEARERRIEYAENAPTSPSHDSREHTLLAGVEWEASGKTDGSLRLGNRRKNFDDAAREDGTDFVWEVDASWRPRSYSTLTLTLARTPSETNGNGDFIDTKTSTLEWTHDWTPRVGTRLAFSYLQQSYAETVRDQDTKNAVLGVSYKMWRWLTWRLDGSWRSRSSTSNTETLNFDRNSYWLTAEFTL
jgi:hypothetical protein